MLSTLSTVRSWPNFAVTDFPPEHRLRHTTSRRSTEVRPHPSSLSAGRAETKRFLHAGFDVFRPKPRQDGPVYILTGIRDSTRRRIRETTSASLHFISSSRLFLRPNSHLSDHRNATTVNLSYGERIVGTPSRNTGAPPVPTLCELFSFFADSRVIRLIWHFLATSAHLREPANYLFP